MATVRKRTWTTSKGEKKSAWCVDFTDQTGSRQRRQFATKREADAFRIETEGQLRSGTFRADAAKVTVREVAESYLDYCQGRMERRERMTRQNLAVYRGHIHNHILHPEHGVAAVKLAQLTVRAVGDLRDRLRSAGVSVPTIRKVLATLHGMLEFAISRDLVAVNAAHGVKVIGRRDEGSRKITPPTKEEMRALLAATDDEDFRLKLLFAAATGLRAGEQHALRWRCVDLEAGMVTVETRVDVYGEEDVAKTAAGMRTVPLGAAVVTALKAWRLRSRFSRSEDLVFPARWGGYEDHANMTKRRFKPACEKAGLVGLNWHGLRHFAVSCWIDAGLTPKTVQTFAGHSSLQVTMDRYGHLFRSDDHKRAMDQIAKGLFG